MKYVTLNNDRKMPVMGLGTWKAAPGEVYQAVRWAIKIGYTHIDCAEIYGNQDEIGQAVADAVNEGDIRREELSLPNCGTTAMRRKTFCRRLKRRCKTLNWIILTFIWFTGR